MGHKPEYGATDIKLILLTLCLHHLLTYLPTSSNYFGDLCIKFPKSDLEFLQKLCTSLFCLKIYKSYLWRIRSNATSSKKLPLLPYSCLGSCSLHSLIFFFYNLFVSPWWNYHFFLLPRAPWFLLIPKSNPLRYLKRFFLVCFSFLTLTRVNLWSITLINRNM